MEESLMVALRIKPCNEHPEWNIQSNTIKRNNSNDELSFDTIYDKAATNEDIYGKSIEKLVDDALNGYNVAICAYGQSGAGKTHTLTGTNSFGLVHLLFNDLFSRISLDKRKYLIRVSYLEIYNEKVRDLLGSSEDLPIMERKDIPFVQGISEQVVTSKEEVEDLMFTAAENRQVGETNLNERSSRSHAILRICLESNDGIGGFKSTTSIINMVDLAGSENGDATAGMNNRQKEGANINKSLLALTKVISILSDKRRCNGHIPYRDSKLTRILKPCLGGNSKTLVICCINPLFVTETCSTLKFAKQVKLVKSRPTVNVSTEDGVLAKYLAEIEALKQQLETQKNEPANSVKESDHLEAERERLKSLMKSIINEKENAIPQTKRVQNRRMTWAPGNGKLGSDSPPSKIFRSNFNNIAEQDESDKFSEFLARMENKNHSFDRISEESEDKSDEFDNLLLKSNRCSDVMEASNSSKVEVKFDGEEVMRAKIEAEKLVTECKASISELTMLLDAANRSVEQLHSDKSQLETNVKEQQERLQSLESEAEKLQQQLKEDQETKHERQLLRDHRDHLSEEVSKLKSKLSDMMTANEALESSLETAMMSLANTEKNSLFEKKIISDENNQLKDENSQLKKEFEHITMKLQLSQQQENSDDRCKKMELLMDNMKGDFDNQLVSLKEEKEQQEKQLNREILDSKDIIKHLKKQIANLEEINQMLITNEKTAELVIPDRQMLIDRVEVDKMNCEISQLKQLNAELETSSATLKRKYEGTERSLSTITSEFRKKTDSLATMEKRVATLTLAKHELELSESKLKQEISDLMFIHDEKIKLQSSYQKLESENKEQLEAFRRAQAKANNLTFEKAKAEADLTILKQDYTRLEEKIERIRNEERQNQENSIKELREKILSLEEIRDKLTTDCEYFQKKLNEKERVHSRLIKRCAEIDSGNNANTTTEENLKQLKSQLDFVTDALHIERTSKKETLEKMSLELSNKTTEVDELNKRLEDLLKQKRRGLQYMKELEAEVKSYRREKTRNPLSEIQKS